MHEGLYRFRDESLIWDNLACYACVLGDMGLTVNDNFLEDVEEKS